MTACHGGGPLGTMDCLWILSNVDDATCCSRALMLSGENSLDFLIM